MTSARIVRYEEELLKLGLSGLAWDAVKHVIRWGWRKLRRKQPVAIMPPTNLRITVRDTAEFNFEVDLVPRRGTETATKPADRNGPQD